MPVQVLVKYPREARVSEKTALSRQRFYSSVHKIMPRADTA